LSEMNSPLFSIIIPSFNSSSQIQKCLDSISKQTNNNYEVLIIDGVSSDDTLHILKINAARDKRVIYISEKDKGIYDAMNKGIDQAKGEWLLFLGSDDELLDSDVLENVSNHISQTQAEMVYGDVLIKGDTAWAKDGDRYDGLFTIEKLLKQNICHQSVFYRRSVFHETGAFNISYQVCADWDMNHRFFARGKTMYIPYTIAKFYTGGTSTQNNRDLFTGWECIFNIRNYYGIGFFNQRFRMYADVFYRNAIKALDKKNFTSSLYFAVFALFHTNKKLATAKAYLAACIKRTGLQIGSS